MASEDNVSVSSSSQHDFSSPWEDMHSDLVLVVEDQSLHVHRFILKMASPVFKAMLSSDFKEKEAATDSMKMQLLLPEKKADDVVALLKQIYPQFNRNSITIGNVEHIYKLADEYQMEGVAVACQEFLKAVDKTKENAMEILLKAQVCHADEARQQCYDILQQLTLDELEKNELFEDTVGPNARNVLLPKARQLEKYLNQLLPNVLGLLGWLLCLSRRLNQGDANKMESPLYECSIHSQPYSYSSSFYPRDVVRCKHCKVSFNEMCKKFLTYYHCCKYPGTSVDQDIGELLEKIYAILEPN